MIRPAVIARRTAAVGLPMAVALGTLFPSPASAQVDLPVPDLPVPDLPTPDLPVPDVPGLEELRACVEEAVAAHDPSEDSEALVDAIMACILDALPDLPAPDLPAPDLPVPDLPAPEPPDPDLPVPGLPV